MSSGSDLSEIGHSDSDLERQLRKAVFKARDDGWFQEITVRKARAAAAQVLGLDEDFFKAPKWKTRSADIIQTAVQEVEKDLEQAASDHPKSSPVKPTAKKRTSAVKSAAPRKRQKRALSDDEKSEPTPSEDSEPEVEEQQDQDEEFEDEEEKPVKRGVKANGASAAKRPQKGTASTNKSETKSVKPKPSARKKAQAAVPRTVVSGSDLSDIEDDQVTGKNESEEELSPNAVQKPAKAVTEESESELSDVLDEPAAKKKKPKEKGAAKSRSSSGPKTSSKSAAKDDKDISPDEAEIKRLQGWLIKCGIRKLWHKELAPFDGAKPKIHHLKEMLKDAGMEGRYSVEKANAIKESRELAADLEAVTEGNEKWGRDGGEPEEPTRKRRVAARFVDFGDEDDDED